LRTFAVQQKFGPETTPKLVQQTVQKWRRATDDDILITGLCRYKQTTQTKKLKRVNKMSEES